MSPQTQTIVVTGVSKGIGRAVALEAAASGANVAGIHRGSDPEAANSLVEEIHSLGGSSLIMTGDAGSTADIDALAAQTVEKFGGIDLWVNNAARIFVQPFLDMTDEDWGSLLNSNLLGYVRGARAAARTMKKQGHGSIVNVSSIVGEQPPTQMSAYVTAKGGIAGLTRALAVELGECGVTVNAVAPGATETPLNVETWTDNVRAIYRDRIPLSRIATPEEISGVILFLAAPQARYLTGQIINVDGGLTLNGSVGHREAGA